MSAYVDSRVSLTYYDLEPLLVCMSSGFRAVNGSENERQTVDNRGYSEDFPEFKGI
jgi:hypothetical protein